MIRIQLSNGVLDMNADETVGMNWTTTRFSTSLRDPFTNDFSIPKTQNNIKLLGTAGLIDSAVQMLGGVFAPATMTIDDGTPKSVKLQVVSVTPKNITICCYENVIPADFMNSNVSDWFEDNEMDTIWEWDRHSKSRLSNYFREYNYGMPYKTQYAQLHPSLKLLDIINELNTVSGYHLPTTQNYFPIDYYLLATKKTVCPQNRRQCIEGVKAPQEGETDDQKKTFKIIAGQHVTNDAYGWQSESTTMELTYNRYAYINATMNISWQVPQSYGTYSIAMFKNGDVYKTFYINVPNAATTSGVHSETFAFSVDDGDVISFKITGLDVFNKVNFMMDCRLTGYDVYDEDYGPDLVYCERPARLILYQYYNTQGVYEINCFADGNTYSYTNNNDGTSTSSFSLPYRSLSYFGFWCNVQEFKIKEMVFSIGWFGGEKVKNINDRYEYVVANDHKQIEGVLTQLDPADSHFGQTSYICYTDDLIPWKYTYDNLWLEKEKWIHKSVFGYVGFRKRANNPNALPTARIPQYKLVRNQDEIEVEFNEIETPIIMRLAAWSGVSYLAPPRKISQMGFDSITCIMKATIETPDIDVDWCDYVYFDGREYMVIGGETNLKDRVTKLTAMLVNYKPSQNG